jgi:hypothetical protein
MAKKATAPKLMTIRDAEQKTGMSRQTLTNWLDSGLLPGMRTSRSIWVSSEAIERLSKTSIGSLNEEVDRLTDELTRKKAQLEENVASIDERIKDINGALEDCANKTAKENVVDCMLKVFGEKLTCREKFIMEHLMKGESVQDVSFTLGLTEKRLWQVFNHGMRRLEESTSIIAENERLKKENERLSNEHAIMKDAYVNVRNKNSELDTTLQTYRILHENIEPYNGEPLTEEEKHLVAILRTKLEDCHLSARTMSGMKRANIETVGDLISRNKIDLLKIKDFGKKSLTELDDLVDSLDLSFGTDVQKYLLREADSFTII